MAARVLESGAIARLNASVVFVLHKRVLSLWALKIGIQIHSQELFSVHIAHVSQVLIGAAWAAGLW